MLLTRDLLDAYLDKQKNGPPKTHHESKVNWQKRF